MKKISIMYVGCIIFLKNLCKVSRNDNDIQARLRDGFSRNSGCRCIDLSNTNIERKDITANFRRSFTKVNVTVGSRNPRGEIIREESSDAARSPIESRGQWRSLRQRRYIYNAFRYTYAHLRVFSRLLSPFSRSWLKMIVPRLKASRSLKSARHYFEPPTGRSLCHKGRDSLLHFETYE